MISGIFGSRAGGEAVCRCAHVSQGNECGIRGLLDVVATIRGRGPATRPRGRVDTASLSSLTCKVQIVDPGQMPPFPPPLPSFIRFQSAEL